MLASLAIAWGWRARLALLAVSLGEALAQIRVAPARAEAAPLPSTDDLADGIRRLARGLAEQGALLEKLRRAVNEKNWQWHQRYRTVDGYNV
jgi:hypothetical protein